MFLGTYTPRLDDKGRLFLPAKYRDDLAEGLVITRGQERCLAIWTTAEFERITERMAAAPPTHKAARDYARMFFAGAYDQTPDKQGRVTVPPQLREYASLERDCVVAGVKNRLELWDAQAWATYFAEQEQAYAELSEEVPGMS